jgi:hypothetical protein
MTNPTGTHPRSIDGQPIAFVDPAGSPSLAGRWFAYRAGGAGWRCVGMFCTEAEARRAVGIEAQAAPK